MALTAPQDSPPTASDDPSADIGRLYELYGERILGYCLREVGSRSEAEDASQTTFLYAYRALKRGVCPETEYVWLHSIARNVCRWQRRTASRRDWVATTDSDVLAATATAPADSNDERMLEIREALACVPDRQRRALLLRELHGLSSAEVAESLGLSASETYALLTRARRSFVKAMLALPGRSTLSVNVWPLIAKLKGALMGAGAKVATTAVVASVAVGGVATQRALVDEEEGSGRPSPAALVPALSVPVATHESSPVSLVARAGVRERRSRAESSHSASVAPSEPASPSPPGAALPALEPTSNSPQVAPSEPGSTAPSLPGADDNAPEAPPLDLDLPGVPDLVPDPPPIDADVGDPLAGLAPEAPPLPPLQDDGPLPPLGLP